MKVEVCYGKIINRIYFFGKGESRMQKTAVKAYAKINLHLDVLGIADNGYHMVNTVMQTVSLCDDVEVSLNDIGVHSIECNIAGIPKDSKNLAWRAADMFFEKTGLSYGADINIIKRIPAAAGLAGGSADAAAVFIALNELCGKPLSEDELCVISARLGADVPFCIAGGAKFADRFGDVLHPFFDLPDCYVVVTCGREGVSTPWAYAKLDETYSGFAEGAYTPRDLSLLKGALANKEILGVCKNMYNIFEGVIEKERAEVVMLRGVMLDSGALGSMMSGSGPSVFGIFDDESKAKAARSAIEATGLKAFLCKPVSR